MDLNDMDSNPDGSLLLFSLKSTHSFIWISSIAMNGNEWQQNLEFWISVGCRTALRVPAYQSGGHGFQSCQVFFLSSFLSNLTMYSVP